MASEKLHTDSLIVHAGRPQNPGEPLNTPLVSASNFQLGEDMVYAREDGTATWQAVESVVGALEEGHAVAWSSGMAAASAVFDQLTVGARVVLPHDCYQGVVSLAKRGAEQGRWTLERLPTEDTAAWVDAAGKADLLWTESPSNPMLGLADLPAIGAATRKSGSLLVVDNTFATPLNQKPLLLGADLVVHSATKYFGGHSDLLAGVLVAGNETLYEQLRVTRKLHGATPGALEAYLTARGLRTLALRLERAQENALALARFLEDHPRVRRVWYPGLKSHPQHELACEQLKGFGAIISFDLGGDGNAAETVCRTTALIRHATSLGSVESTMERRAAHGGQESIPAGLIRLSVGIEYVEDLLTDLEQALDQSA